MKQSYEKTEHVYAFCQTISKSVLYSMPTFQIMSLDISLIAGGECEQFLEMSPSFFKTRTLAGKSIYHSMGPALQIH